MHSGCWSVGLGANVLSFLFLGGIDSDLDSNEAATDFFALDCLDGLLLLFFAANVDEAIAFAPPRASKLSADDAGRDDIDTSVGEEGKQSLVVDVEAKVGNKERRCRGFANRILTGWTSVTWCSGLPWTKLFSGSRGLGRTFCGGCAFNFLWGVVFCSGCGLVPWLALKRDMSMTRGQGRRNRLTVNFFFFLGLAASSVPGRAAASSALRSPFASASVTSPGTALAPRLPGRLLALLSLFSLSFCSAGLAISTMTFRPSSS